METGLSELKELFDLKDRDLRTYSPLGLAFIGDGIYDLIIRTLVMEKGNRPANDAAVEPESDLAVRFYRAKPALVLDPGAA